MIHEVNGGSTDSLLLDTSEGIAASAIGGAVRGDGRNCLRRILRSQFGNERLRERSRENDRGQGAMWTFAGLEKQTLPHYLGTNLYGVQERSVELKSELIQRTTVLCCFIRPCS